MKKGVRPFFFVTGIQSPPMYMRSLINRVPYPPHILMLYCVQYANYRNRWVTKGFIFISITHIA